MVEVRSAKLEWPTERRGRCLKRKSRFLARADPLPAYVARCEWLASRLSRNCQDFYALWADRVKQTQNSWFAPSGKFLSFDSRGNSQVSNQPRSLSQREGIFSTRRLRRRAHLTDLRLGETPGAPVLAWKPSAAVPSALHTRTRGPSTRRRTNQRGAFGQDSTSNALRRAGLSLAHDLAADRPASVPPQPDRRSALSFLSGVHSDGCHDADQRRGAQGPRGRPSRPSSRDAPRALHRPQVRPRFRSPSSRAGGDPPRPPRDIFSGDHYLKFVRFTTRESRLTISPPPPPASSKQGRDLPPAAQRAV